MTSSSILILGGVGFIGRHFVHYVVQNNLAQYICVVDKVLPQTAYLSEAHEASFKKVEFRQGNLINPGKYISSFSFLCSFFFLFFRLLLISIFGGET